MLLYSIVIMIKKNHSNLIRGYLDFSGRFRVFGVTIIFV